MRRANTADLLRRYDERGPRYTSYPTVPEFNRNYSEVEYRAKLAEADRASEEPLSLYVHLPFCEQRCTYCACNVVITQRREVAAKYLEYLHREIDILGSHLRHRRTISQYHWGGGTPTYHGLKEMEILHGKITKHFEIEADAEAGIEVDRNLGEAIEITKYLPDYHLLFRRRDATWLDTHGWTRTLLGENRSQKPQTKEEAKGLSRDGLKSLQEAIALEPNNQYVKSHFERARRLEEELRDSSK